MNKFLVLSLLLCGIATASAVDKVLDCTKDHTVKHTYESGVPVDSENTTDWNQIKKDSGLDRFQVKYETGMASGYMVVPPTFACYGM